MDAKVKALAKNEILIAEFPLIKAEYDRLAAHATAPLGREEEAVAGVLSDIESVAAAAPMEILSLKPQSVKKMSGYSQVVIEITAEAGVQGLAKFLYDIEGNEKFLKVMRMTIVGADAQSPLRCTLLVSRVFIE